MHEGNLLASWNALSERTTCLLFLDLQLAWSGKGRLALFVLQAPGDGSLFRRVWRACMRRLTLLSVRAWGRGERIA